MIPFERALVSFYRPSIVTFPLSLRVSEILSLLFCSMPLFPYPTSSLPKISPCSLGLGELPFGYKERRCWASCPCNQFPRFPTQVITIRQRHRRTDGRHAIPRPRICTKVHCAVKTTDNKQIIFFRNIRCTFATNVILPILYVISCQSSWMNLKLRIRLVGNIYQSYI